MQLRAGTAQDASSIRALLETGDLPTSDLARSSPQFVVACDNTNRIVAAGALQALGDSALLRSVVVTPALRGTGLGQRVVQELERMARATQVKQLALLTLTAKRFFERQGYRVISRQDVPEALQGTEEFQSLCPASATCMVKSLAET
ncbi:MAG: arsenic resistance N-acetyltransferase ArsN2 [Steroidobacteraceae bacterium]